MVDREQALGRGANLIDLIRCSDLVNAWLVAFADTVQGKSISKRMVCTRGILIRNAVLISESN